MTVLKVWATLGNLLRLQALLVFISAPLPVYWTITGNHALPIAVPLVLVGTAIELVVAVLAWLAKGPLIGGNSVVRLLVGLYAVAVVLLSAGLALITIGIIYLFTSEPESHTGFFNRPAPPKLKFSAPVNWHANGRVGPSGAMVYSNADQDQSVGVFSSYVPVQVLDRRNGLARVIAATGEAGWIDLRQLTESV